MQYLATHFHLLREDFAGLTAHLARPVTGTVRPLAAGPGVGGLREGRRHGRAGDQQTCRDQTDERGGAQRLADRPAAQITHARMNLTVDRLL